jgi:hypothetical protein
MLQLDLVRLESHRNPIKIFECLAVGERGQVSAAMLKALRIFNFASECYRKREFTEALRLFLSAIEGTEKPIHKLNETLKP